MSAMKTVSTEHAKQELARLVKHSVKGHEAFRITHETGDAVLLSREDYETLIEAIEALSEPSDPAVTKRAERPLR